MGTDPAVIWLDEQVTVDRALLGGKGAGLAGLAAAGFAVPRGFVLPPGLARALGTADSRERATVLAAYASLAPNSGPVAVRSSAADEDGAEQSFAGQHLTVLGVTGEDALIEAVAACLASLRSEGADAYRAGVSSSAEMAVVVQRMVSADSAGVVFTTDPVTGNPDCVVVEAVLGLGQSLVSGAAEAERWAFARPALTVLDCVRTASDVLTEAQARSAAAEALRAEELFGAAQDVEFAFEAGKLWLLQSRPVTAAGRSPIDDLADEFDTPTSEADLWTSANIGEVLPGLLTPLAITAFAANADRAYCVGYQRLKMLSKHEWPHFVGFFANRAFLHVGNTRLIADRAFGSSADAIEHRFLGAEQKVATRGSRSWRNIKHRFLSLIPLLRMARRIHREGERIARQTLAMERRVKALDVAVLSDAELDLWRLRIADLVAETFAVHLQASGCAGAGFDLVARILRPVLGGATEASLPALFTGLEGVESAQISLDLWGLSRIAKDHGLAAVLEERSSGSTGTEFPDVWRAALAGFLARHGHRGLNEMEPSYPSWRQDPRPVLDLVSAYIDLPLEQSPPVVFARQRVERLALTQSLEARMNPLRRAVFKSILRDAQTWVALRERTKSVIVRGTRMIEYLLPETKRRLVARGTIAAPGDLFFLSGDELTRVLSGERIGLRAAVLRRRRAMERNRYLRLPERFVGRPVPLPPTSASHASVLTGTPVSPGQVTGRARVIRDPRVDGPLQPGEILVAPVTDASWTPLFALAAGLVVDMGSALSHGSTVAREYGLPAVVNVRAATTAIRTGDIITVDGTSGTVAFVQADPAARGGGPAR